MKIFISWSGSRSKPVAIALKGWIKTVLQATEPWVSTNDIDGGSVWFGKITEQLKESQTSIICLTPENVSEPWILFEAGAVAKGIEANRICTLLIGLNPTDIKGPLAQFNHTACDREGLRKLIGGFNKSLKQPIDDTQFTIIFDALWPHLSPVIEEALKPQQTAPKQTRPSEDMLAEILERIRGIENNTVKQFPDKWPFWNPNILFAPTRAYGGGLPFEMVTGEVRDQIKAFIAAKVTVGITNPDDVISEILKSFPISADLARQLLLESGMN